MKALHTIVAALPADLPAAVVIVQHLPGGPVSVLPAILGRVTRLRVKHPLHGEPLVAGTVYIALGGLHLLVADGTVRLDPGQKVNYSRPSVDVLFTSVARMCGERSVGVVLSGGNRDGAAGLAEIRKAGGTTIVQDPAEAAYPRMPAAALALDGHQVLRLADIGPTLVRLAAALAAMPDSVERNGSQFAN